MCGWQFAGGLDEQALAGLVEVGSAGEQAGAGDAQAEQGVLQRAGRVACVLLIAWCGLITGVRGRAA